MNRFRRFDQFLLAAGVFLLAGALVGGAVWAVYRLVRWGTEAPPEWSWLVYALGLVLLALAAFAFVAGWLLRNGPKGDFAHESWDGVRKLNSKRDSLAGTQSVLVYINGGWQPALFVERTAAGAHVVYVPHAPDARSGAVYVVESFQVTPLNIPTREMRKIIRHGGKGLSSHAGQLFATE